jgi:hypothetical protein
MNYENLKRFAETLDCLDKHAPQWNQPLVDVIDTADYVRLGAKQWLPEDQEPSDELIVGLTRLVLEREVELRRREREAGQ